MITILSNVTMSGPWFSKTLSQLSGAQVNIPDGYNTWAQALLNPDSALLSSEAVFLILDGSELVGQLHSVSIMYKACSLILPC